MVNYYKEMKITNFQKAGLAAVVFFAVVMLIPSVITSTNWFVVFLGKFGIVGTIFVLLVIFSVFRDENDKMNLSVNDIGGEVVIVSNFTLCADTSHGKRPSFINAAKPDVSLPLYNKFVEEFSKHTPVKTGVFGADMEIDLVNDGPVTIILTEEPSNNT